MLRKLFVPFAFALLWYPSMTTSTEAGTGPIGKEIAAGAGRFVEISAEDLEDKIRGGLLAQLLGNLNGLPHENKYYDEPGNVEQYTPALANGARTDDDTDIEWVYISAMQRDRTALLGPERITALWQHHINDHIWCANLYTRQLMDIGIDPPLTGNLALNPWSGFNISGQLHRSAADRQSRSESLVRLQYLRPIRVRIVWPDCPRHASDRRTANKIKNSNRSGLCRCRHRPAASKSGLSGNLPGFG